MVCFARYARDLLKGARSFLARACSARRARGVRLSVRGLCCVLSLTACACSCVLCPCRPLRLRSICAVSFVCAPRLGLRFSGRVGGALLPAPLRFAEARAPLVASAVPALVRAPPLCGVGFSARPRPPSARVRLVCLPFVGVCICAAPRGLRFGAGSVFCVRVVCFACVLFVCFVTFCPALCLCALRARCSRLLVRGCQFAVVSRVHSRPRPPSRSFLALLCARARSSRVRLLVPLRFTRAGRFV